MEPLLMLNATIVGLNTLLLLALLVFYARMWTQVRSRFTLGLVIFAIVLLVQNAAQLYFFFTMQMYFAGGVERLVLFQNILGTVASAFLTYVTFAPDAVRSPARARPESGTNVGKA